MRPARRSRRGRRADRIDSAKFLRRLRRFHDLTQRGASVAVAARCLGVSLAEAQQMDDFLTDLIADLKASGGAR